MWVCCGCEGVCEGVVGVRVWCGCVVGVRVWCVRVWCVVWCDGVLWV